jgi:hypothetical protein
MCADPSGGHRPPPPHIVETEVRRDVSPYDAQNERVLVLNGTGSDVWRRQGIVTESGHW